MVISARAHIRSLGGDDGLLLRRWLIDLRRLRLRCLRLACARPLHLALLVYGALLLPGWGDALPVLAALPDYRPVPVRPVRRTVDGGTGGEEEEEERNESLVHYFQLIAIG